MKYWLFVFFLGAFSANLSAQAENTAAQTNAAELATVYALSQTQQAEMLVIQQRRFRNQEEIAPLREQNPELYWQKRKSILLNTDGSIRRMLNETQRKIHDQRLLERRREESSLIKQWHLEGKSKLEIERLLLERA